MNTNTMIMVQIADQKWTMDALHRACRLGRTMPSHIALVKMIPVQYPGWLGTELGNRNFTEQDQREIINCEATLQDYHIEFSLTVFQYLEIDEAILQAANMLNASIVFATLPHSFIPFWRNLRLEVLRRRLGRNQHRLIDNITDNNIISKSIIDMIKTKA